MVYIFLADGFEELEALTVVDVLRRGGCLIKTVSIMGRHMVTGSHGITITANEVFEDINPDDAEMLAMPGGLDGAARLKAHEGLKAALIKFNEEGKKLAAICAAPTVLGAHGILKGRKATVYPGLEDGLIGADPTYANVTMDGNITTGRGPALAMEFALTLLKELKGEEVAKETADGLLYKIF